MSIDDNNDDDDVVVIEVDPGVTSIKSDEYVAFYIDQ